MAAPRDRRGIRNRRWSRVAAAAHWPGLRSTSEAALDPLDNLVLEAVDELALEALQDVRSDRRIAPFRVGPLSFGRNDIEPGVTFVLHETRPLLLENCERIPSRLDITVWATPVGLRDLDSPQFEDVGPAYADPDNYRL